MIRITFGWKHDYYKNPSSQQWCCMRRKVATRGSLGHKEFWSCAMSCKRLLGLCTLSGVKNRYSVSLLTSKEENVLESGRAEVAREEKWLGASLQQKLPMEGGAVSCSGRHTLNWMKKWSETCDRVTISVSVVQFRVRMRLRSLLALRVGGLQTCCSSKQCNIGKKPAELGLSNWDKHGVVMLRNGGQQRV